MQEINSSPCLESGDGMDLLSGPLNISRATTDSTILDFPRSQSEMSEKEEQDNSYHDDPPPPPLTDEDRYQKLLRIRDCLGLLRELFFMSRQTISMEQR